MVARFSRRQAIHVDRGSPTQTCERWGFPKDNSRRKAIHAHRGSPTRTGERWGFPMRPEVRGTMGLPFADPSLIHRKRSPFSQWRRQEASYTINSSRSDTLLIHYSLFTLHSGGETPLLRASPHGGRQRTRRKALITIEKDDSKSSFSIS